MIKLTRLNGKPFYINPDLIESLEAQPDTIVALTTGNRVSVKEKPEEIVDRIVEFKARIQSEGIRKSLR